MQALQMLTDWNDVVQGLLGPLHGHQKNALADLSFGWLRAGSPFPIEWGTQLPTETSPSSTRRRGERFAANTRIELDKFLGSWIPNLLEPWFCRGDKILLILDETAAHNDEFRRMQLSVAYHGRAVPLSWRAYKGKPEGKSLPTLILEMLQEVEQHLPTGAKVTLLTDRGLAWPRVLDRAEHLGWAFVVRVQGQTKTRQEGEPEVTARQRVTKKGQQWYGEVDAYKKHGWIRGYLSCAWAPESEQPWLLFSSDPAGLHQARGYCKRMWIEESFRDDKSSGLNWQDSQITEPERAERLLMLVALASVLALNWGTWLEDNPQYRKKIDPRRARRYSLFALGRLWLQWLCEGVRLLSHFRLCGLALDPTHRPRDPTHDLGMQREETRPEKPG